MTAVPPSVKEKLELAAPAPPDGPVMMGAVVSMMRALLLPSESLLSIAGSESAALLLAASWMEAPLRAREEVSV